MNESDRTIILEKLDKKLKEMKQKDKKIREYSMKIKLFNKNELDAFYKKLKKDLKYIDIEELTISLELLFK